MIWGSTGGALVAPHSLSRSGNTAGWKLKHLIWREFAGVVQDTHWTH
jgi:hypothetical protein